MMKSDTTFPFVSVYVPDYQSSPSRSSQKGILQSPVLGFKAKARSIRRCVNRLSRLQKSFLLMIFMVLIIFSLILVTITWVPQLSSSNVDNSLNSIFNEENIKVNLHLEETYVGRTAKPILQDNHYENVGGRFQPVLIKTSVKPRNLDKGLDLSLSRSPGILPTIPRGLQPDFSDNIRTVTTWDTKPGLIKGLFNEKAAEDIRKVISMDQVIPLRPRPKNGVTRGPSVISRQQNSRKSSELRLKLRGPENMRQKAVVDAFVHAWTGYKKFAWGRDHLRPISGSGQDWFGLGLTLIDSLDTMYIMGLQQEYFEARDWVEESLSFDDVSRNVNLFETTIRVLGGLLSAYHLTQEQIFLTKAQELGSILVVGFKSPSGVPYSDINLRGKTAHGPSWNPDSTTSEATTLQLEFRDLSRATHFPIYEKSAMNVSIHVHHQWKMDGLVPIHISPATGEFRSSSVITLGARGDSYYEYLLKQWIQTGKTIDFNKVHSAFWDCDEELRACVKANSGSAQAAGLTESTVNQEIEQYISIAPISRKENPLAWWSGENGKRFPSLNGLVFKYLSSPASTVFSERLFSTEGNIYEDKRNRLLPDNGEMLEFINRNLPFLKFNLRDDYLAAVEGMRKNLLKRTTYSNLTYLGELEQSGTLFRPKMDHLVCYLPGTLALGVSHGLPEWHLDLAKSLLHTCYLTYKQQPTGLAPEITYFRMEDDKTSDFYVKSNDAHNLLRPETVESLFYLYQITGDKKYQEWGWEIFESFMKYTRVEHGFTSINNVLDPENTKPRDMLESFFLAETLKYFYLLFSDKVIFDFKQWVFNTEAHPLPVFDQ